MTTTASTRDGSTPTTSGPTRPVDTDPTVRFRRIGSAVAMPVSVLGFMLACLLYAWATRDGGDDSTGAHAIALYGAHPFAIQAATVAVVLGAILLVPALLAVLRLVRRRSPRLGLWAVCLMTAGYIVYVYVAGSNLLVAQLGVDGIDAAATVDRAQEQPSALPMFLVFVAGNLLGTALLAVAILRTPGLPRAAAYGILAWPVLHVTGLIVGSEWFEVAGGTLQVVGFAMLAAATLRMSDIDWVARGCIVPRSAAGRQASATSSR